MKTKSKLLAVALIAGGTMFAAPRLSIGVSVGGYGPGAYPPPAAAQQYVPPCPGPGYTWVNGIWRAPVVNVAPRYVEPRGDYARRDFDRDDHDRDRGHANDRGFNNRDQNRNDHRDDRNTFRR
jgi:hypothetical protein